MLTMEESNQNVISMYQLTPFLYKRGMSLYNKGELEPAASYLERALQLDDSNCKVLYQLGNCLFEQGKYNASNDIFEKLLKLDDAYDTCHYFMARNYTCLGLFERAQACINIYLEKSDDDELREEALELLEIVQMEEEEDGFFLQDDMLIKLEEAVQCIRICDFEKAILLLEDVLIDYPEYWSAYNHLAIAFFKKGDYEMAMNILEDLLERNPGNLYALCNQMLFYYSLEKEDKAAYLVNELAHVYPLCAEQQAKLGISFAAIGEIELGYKWLYFLYKNGYMGDISFFYWLAYTAYTKGNEKIAKVSWKEVLRFDKDFEGHAPWD